MLNSLAKVAGRVAEVLSELVNTPPINAMSSPPAVIETVEAFLTVRVLLPILRMLSPDEANLIARAIIRYDVVAAFICENVYALAALERVIASLAV